MTERVRRHHWTHSSAGITLCVCVQRPVPAGGGVSCGAQVAKGTDDSNQATGGAAASDVFDSAGRIWQMRTSPVSRSFGRDVGYDAKTARLPYASLQGAPKGHRSPVEEAKTRPDHARTQAAVVHASAPPNPEEA